MTNTTLRNILGELLVEGVHSQEDYNFMLTVFTDEELDALHPTVKPLTDEELVGLMNGEII